MPIKSFAEALFRPYDLLILYSPNRENSLLQKYRPSTTAHSSIGSFNSLLTQQREFTTPEIQAQQGPLLIFSTKLGGMRQARAIVQRMGDARGPQKQATVMDSLPQKINLISCGPMAHVSDIKLIRTDTTLDLSQKAEKGMIYTVQRFNFYSLSSRRLS